MNKNELNTSKNSNFSTFGFFKYFKNILGYHIYFYIVLNFIVGLIDGFGLAMFIPLLKIVTGTDDGNQSLGNLDFLLTFFENLGIPLTLVPVLLIMISIFALKGVLSYLRQLYFIKLRLSSIRKIRFQLIDGFRSLSYRGYTVADPGKIQFGMLGETGRLVQAMTNFISTIQNLVVLLTYIFLAFLSNWRFAILVAIGGFLSNFIYKIINDKTRLQAKRLSGIGSKFNRYLIQSIQNFKYLKATNSFEKYETNLKNAIEEFEQTQFKIGKLNAIASNFREPIIIIIIALVIIVQIKFIGGEFGGILVSLLLFYRALTYLVAMQNTWNVFISNAAGLDAVVALQDEFKHYSEPEQEQHQLNLNSKIELQNISLKYGDAKILNNINLEIQPNTTIALVGESGAGKSTLANVIGALVEANEGTLVINGEPLSNKSLNTYRNKIGYIAQEPVIFSDSIYNNVTFWSEKTKENIDKFWQTMKLVHLKAFVTGLPEQEDAPLGNNGILVSGGQKQRISIARELFRNVEVLIMDEATSALDSETEQVIQKNIESLHGKYTMVIIAHRLSTIKHADVIYLMKDGEIINKGDYSSLYNSSNDFQRMVNLQEI